MDRCTENIGDAAPAAAHFNLIDEPWIPVLYVDGSSAELSLRELFERAHRVRSITGEIPLDYIAVLRLALAVLYAAYGEVEGVELLTAKQLMGEWRALYEVGSFDLDVINGYLDEVHNGFDLFGDAPFYQVAGLEHAAKGPDPISELITDMPKPDKFLFSLRSQRAADEISFAEAARYLLLLQAYGVAGIKSPVKGFHGAKGGKAYAPKGLLGTGWCGALSGIFLEGENLFETIMKNWVLALDGTTMLGIVGDTAPWEREEQTADMVQREPAGPIDLLTWQSRRTRLVLNEDKTAVSGVIICYGDVTGVADKATFEFMTSWRESTAQQKKLGSAHVPLMPVGPDPSRALWRGLPSLLSVSCAHGSASGDFRAGVIRWQDELERELRFGSEIHGTSHRFARIRSQGLTYGTQSSVIADMVDDHIDLDSSMLCRDSVTVPKAIDVVRQADEAVSALVQLICNVQRANGADRPDGGDVRERAYDELDDIFRRRLAVFSPDVDADAFCDSWRAEIQMVVERMAREELAATRFSVFRERDVVLASRKHEAMTAGRAIALFQARLGRALARPHDADGGTSSTKSDKEGSDDGVI